MNRILYALIVLRPLFRFMSGRIEILTDINTLTILGIGLIIVIFKRRTSKIEYLYLFYFVMLIIISLISASRLDLSFKDPYWMLIAIVIIMCSTNEGILIGFVNFVKKNINYIKWEIILINVILLISIFDSSCYEIRWGEGRYFTSYAEGPHPLAFLLILVIALIFLIKHLSNEKKYIFLLIIPIFSIMLTGARTVLITVVCLILIFSKINFRKITKVGSVILTIVVFLGDLLIKIPILKKFAVQFSSGDITSGRIEFWIYDLKSFNDLNFVQKIIGGGFEYPYLVNYNKRGVYIWAHNDIINTLLAIGLLGLIIYLYFIIKQCSFLYNKLKVTNYFMFILFFVGTMILNGFYNYTDFVITLLIISATIIYNSIDGGKREKNA